MKIIITILLGLMCFFETLNASNLILLCEKSSQKESYILDINFKNMTLISQLKDSSGAKKLKKYSISQKNDIFKYMDLSEDREFLLNISSMMLEEKQFSNAIKIRMSCDIMRTR